MALTATAHQLIRRHFQSEGAELRTALDATCGNGYDTEFLCSLGFKSVFAFDVQSQAMSATKQRLESAGFNNYTLLLQSHADLDSFIHSKLDCAMFNFGYLPRGDKSITTQSESSLVAIKKTVGLLAQNGILSALCYPGHEQGYKETNALVDYFHSLPTEFKLKEVRSVGATDRTPLLLMLTKISQ